MLRLTFRRRGRLAAFLLAVACFAVVRAQTTLTIGTIADLNGDGITGDNLATTGATAAPSSGSKITAAQVASLLQGTGSLSLSAEGNITINSGIAWNSANSLSLAGDSILLSAGVVNTGAGAISLNAIGTLNVGSNVQAGGTLTISAGTLTASSGLTAGALIFSSSATVAGTFNTSGANGSQTYSQALALSGSTTINAGAGNIALAGVNGAQALTLSTSGTIQLASAIGNSTPLSSLTIAGGGNTTVNGGSIRTTGDQSYAGTLKLGANTDLTTAGGNVTIGAVAGNNRNLTLNAGSGAISISANATGIATLTGNNTSTFTASGAVSAATIDFSAHTTGAVSFASNVTATTLTTGTNGYNLALTGTTTDITNATTFLNTGTLTLGDGAGDTVTVRGGMTATSPDLVLAAGTLETYGNPLTFGNITATKALSFRTTGNSTATGGNVTTGTITGGSNDVTLNAGTGGVVAIGGVSSAGTLTLANSNGATFSGPVGAANLVIFDSAATRAVDFQSDVTVTGNVTTAGTANAYNVRLGSGANTIGGEAMFSNTGTLTLGSDAASLTAVGAGVTATAPSSTTVYGTLRATAGNISISNLSVPTGTSPVFQATSGYIQVGNASLQGGNLTLTLAGGASDGAYDAIASVDNGATLRGAFGVGTLFNRVAINSGNATVLASLPAGSVVAGGNLALAGTASLPASINGALTVGGSLSSATGNYNLTLAGPSVTVVGNATFLNSGTLTLGTSASSVSNFGGGIVATAPSSTKINGSLQVGGTFKSAMFGNVTFNTAGGVTVADGQFIASGNLTLGGNVTITAGGPSNFGYIQLRQVDGPYSLDLDAARSVLIGGDDADQVGGTTPLQSLSVNSSTTDGIIVRAASVATVGAQSYNRQTLLRIDTTLSSATGDISFGGILKSDSNLAFPGPYAATLTAGGNITLAGGAGGSAPLKALTATAGGRIAVGGSITSRDAQSYTGAVVLTQSVGFTSNNSGNLSFSSTLNGAYDATFTSGGTLTFGGAVGATTPLSNLATGSSGATTLNGAGVTTSGNQRYDNTLTLGANAVLKSTAGNISVASVIGANHSLEIQAATASTLGGATGLTSFTKSGVGNLTLTGATTFSGALTLSQGALTLAGDNLLPATSTLNFGASTTLNVAGDQTIGAFGSSQSTAAIKIDGGKTFTVTLGNSNTGTLFAGTIADGATSGGKVVIGSNNGLGHTVQFTRNNTYTGGTEIQSGGALLLGANSTAGSIAGNVLNNGALIFHRSNTLTFGGTISGTGSVSQGVTSGVTGGATVLTGSNTYSGGTTIYGGELLVRNSSGSATGSGAVTVSPGASASTAVFGGSGTITGPLTVNAGGTVRPEGRLAVGTTTFAGDTVLAWPLADASAGAGTGYGLLAISGSLILNASSTHPLTIAPFTTNGTALALAASFNPDQTITFNLVSATGGISGYSSSSINLDMSGFQNSYTGTWAIAANGNNLDLTYTASAIPEPATVGLLAGTAALGLALHRRRSRSRLG